ncbi:hypothetical protein AB3S75_030660 [Citrus x aurantiifolia]
MTFHQLPSSFLSTALLFMFIFPHCSSVEYDGAAIFPTVKQDEKVNLSVYYESLSDTGAEFISHDLGKVFEKGLTSIVNLRLIPWGKAQIVEPNETIVCEHGEDECYFNVIHACAIKAWPEQLLHFTFIKCLEETSWGPTLDKEKVWRTCCQNLKLSPNLIKDCYDNGTGRWLELIYAAETERLKPPIQFVPWLTLNGDAVGPDYGNFVKYVCEAYSGSHVPEACKEMPKSAKTSAAEKETAILLKQMRPKWKIGW